MVAHGVLLLFFALVAGVGLWVKLVGGFEFVPGTITQFDIPGTADGWAKAHRGTPMNALMVIAIALVLPYLGFSRKAQTWLAVIIVGAGWANTIFYYFANFSDNRGLTFGANAFGPGSLNSFIALFPAAVFGIASLAATLYMAWKILQSKD
ncbi:hypothetical protein DKG75_16855 [Zavarzinia compransoris]|uniref:Styrene-oxide isomerase n=2 Tax=Zavarzinia compransoris TaxID=1264899 RepID=A0A317DXJ7_9PROT|nr:hypothetical protein DKG75_16855 [Zavarzinia compransoris]